VPRLLAGPDPKEWPKPTLEQIVGVCSEIAKEGHWLALRNSAMVAMDATFGKRAGEVTSLRRSDVWIEGDELVVQFMITKVAKPPRKRCTCGRVNKNSWGFCVKCGASLEDAEKIPSVKVNSTRVKRRRLDYPLVGFILKWWKEVPEVEAGEAANFIFPPTSSPGIFHTDTSLPLWDKHVTRRTPWQVLHDWASDFWPHLLRHTLATKFSGQGYSEFDLMDWFDWTRYETAKRYVQLGGGERIKKMGQSMA
jgi:integrase